MAEQLFKLVSNFKIKAADDSEDLIIEGYANTTTVDRTGDIIIEDAWKQGGVDNYKKNPILLANHNYDNPIGKATEISVDSGGLHIVGSVSKAAGKFYDLIKEEVLRTFSVGFRVKDYDYDKDTDVFIIKNVELYEISVVSVPANADSTFSLRKGFESDKDFEKFKQELGKEEEVIADSTKTNKPSKEEDINRKETMTKEEKAALEAQIRADIQKENDEKAARAAEIADAVKAATTSVVEETNAQTEKLVAEIEKRFETEQETFGETIKGLEEAIAEKSTEISAMLKNKMSYKDKDPKVIVKDKDVDDAMLLSKILKKDFSETKLGKAIIEKSGTEHYSGNSSDWEQEFNLRVYDDVRERLVVEPLFQTINMNTVKMQIPLNPEANYGTWVTTAQFNASTSSGTTRLHTLTDTTLTAYKLATKELLGYEEEDDSIIPLLPIIREASIRRMARSSDKALLIGDSGQAAAAGEGNYPFNGIATIGTDDSRTQVQSGTFATRGANPVTVAEMQSLRRKLGRFGHNPADLIYVINHEVYFDLLEDADFRTMDLVGEKATILKGQLGSLAGTPVIVSNEFPTEAIDSVKGVCINLSNYLMGTYKNLVVERERSVENQTNLLVMTRRFGFLEMFPDNATVSTLVNAAS